MTIISTKGIGNHIIQYYKQSKYHYSKWLMGLWLTGGALFAPYCANADIISSTDKYAWAENAGWLDFSATHEQATVYFDHLEGYVWSESAGWIRLGTYSGGGIHTYANDAADTYGVNNDGHGNLSGYAWGENIGWVSFNPGHSRVTIDPITGDFDGYAWSEAMGWIHFQNNSPAYKVKQVFGTTPDKNIPTLSVWGLILLTGLLALQARRRIVREPAG